ncbi:MAG: hypothetical protein H7Z74_02180 [Anaerolineae bacterium]|nr:hypothetical protein [Gemmatimonadaceae bacterium]
MHLASRDPDAGATSAAVTNIIPNDARSLLSVIRRMSNNQLGRMDR